MRGSDTIFVMDKEQERALWKEVGSRLRDARLAQKLTLEQLAEQTSDELTFGAIGHYENGRRPLPLPTAIMLARLLKASPSYILCVGEEGKVTYGEDEIRLLLAFRKLPLEDRASYLNRIEQLAKIYGDPVPDERLPAVMRQGPPTAPSRRKQKARS